jgi:putative phosphoesterase
MRIGVVSDTHNNLKNIDKIIALFNDAELELVVHTGDITNGRALERFSGLSCLLCGTYGNNDRHEIELEEVAKRNNFKIQDPPYEISQGGKNIVIFHEPEEIDSFLKDNKHIDIVLHGHTHRYREEIKDNTLIFNPGESAGMLKGKNAIGIIDLLDLSVERIFF